MKILAISTPFQVGFFVRPTRKNASSRPALPAVALGEDPLHFRHILGTPTAQGLERLGEALAQGCQRIVDPGRHFPVIGAQENAVTELSHFAA